MKSFFIKDSTLKVISFIVAVLLWFYVILIVDPSVDISVKDISLRYTNQSVLEERGLSLVADPDAKVELKIRGSRKKIANIDNKNIYATVDLANMTKVGTFSIPISISIPYEYEEIVSKKPNNATVIIDKIVTTERKINIDTEGGVANGYIAGTPESSITTVTLKGASTLVERIHGVGATLDFDGRTGDISDREKLYFTDSNGKKISEKDSIYESVSMNISAIEINCPVMKLKTVPIEIDTSALGEGYKVTIQPSNVTIYAENEILDIITKITAKVNINSLATEGVQQVKLDIPEGVSMRDGITEVTIKAEKRD